MPHKTGQLRNTPEPCGRDRADGNPHLSVTLPTALGELRNALVIGARDVVFAIGGSCGTLSEIAFAMKSETPTVVIGDWKADDLYLTPPRRTFTAPTLRNRQ